MAKFCLNIPDDIQGRLKAIAAKTGRSITGMIVESIKCKIEHYEWVGKLLDKAKNDDKSAGNGDKELRDGVDESRVAR